MVQLDLWSVAAEPIPDSDVLVYDENMPEVTFSVKETAQYLKVSEARVRDLLEEGRFPGAYKKGRIWRIPAEEVIHFERLSVTGRPKRKPGRPKKGCERRRNSY